MGVEGWVNSLYQCVAQNHMVHASSLCFFIYLFSLHSLFPFSFPLTLANHSKVFNVYPFAKGILFFWVHAFYFTSIVLHISFSFHFTQLCIFQIHPCCHVHVWSIATDCWLVHTPWCASTTIYLATLPTSWTCNNSTFPYLYTWTLWELLGIYTQRAG